jgi:hypothetical protein
MGNLTVKLDDSDEKIVRNLAIEKYGGKKGSIGKVLSESIALLRKESKKEFAKQKIFEGMDKGFYFGKKLYKTRDDLYDKK